MKGEEEDEPAGLACRFGMQAENTAVERQHQECGEGSCSKNQLRCEHTTTNSHCLEFVVHVSILIPDKTKTFGALSNEKLCLKYQTTSAQNRTHHLVLLIYLLKRKKIRDLLKTKEHVILQGPRKTFKYEKVLCCYVCKRLLLNARAKSPYFETNQ
jgi:hypothetical protein